MAFELDGVERTAPDRIEVRGRWYGIRGRRFLRPTLDYQVDGRRGRALALLEHKPWTAEEGQEWVVAFPWEGEDETFTGRLAVGSDMAVAVTPDGAGSPDVLDEAPPPADDDPGPMRRELAAATELLRDLREELARVEAQRDAAQADVTRLTAESKRASGEVDSFKRRIDAANAARIEAVTEGDTLRAALSVAENEREYTSRERDRALARCKEAVAERDRASAGRQVAVDDKRAADRAVSEAMQRLEATEARLAAAEARLEDAQRKPAPVPISAAIEPGERAAGWGARAGAIAALCAFGATLLAVILWALL